METLIIKISYLWTTIRTKEGINYQYSKHMEIILGLKQTLVN
jgi:hypothetical protein